MIIFGVFVQTRRIRLQEGSHLVDEGARAAGTDTVHALFHVAALKIDDLCVLAAKLNRHVRDRREGLQGCGHGDHLLYKGDLQVVCQRETAGTSDDGMHREVSKLFKSLGEKSRKGFPDISKMSFVIGKEYLMPVVQNGNLDGSGTDVDAKRILHITHFLFAPSCIKW